MNAKNPPTDRRRRVRSALEYLDREEDRAAEALKSSMLAAGEDLCRITDVRGIVRRHPVVALGAGAALGAVLAPYLADALRGGLSGGRGGKGVSGEAVRAWVRRIVRFG